MDGDGFNDTPEDPSITVVNQCGPGPSRIKFEGKRYTPPRTNVMSYYGEARDTYLNQGPLVQTFSPQQIKRMYGVLLVRGLLNPIAP